jgi:hypothetical protein
MDLNPVTVELDSVNPALSGWHLLARSGHGRFDEAKGKDALRRSPPDSTLKRH